MLILSYLGLLSIIPYVASKHPDVRWHAKQGLTLALAMIVASVAIAIVSALPLIGWLFGLLGPLVSLAGLVLIVVGIAKALGGERWRMPVIAELAEKW